MAAARTALLSDALDNLTEPRSSNQSNKTEGNVDIGRSAHTETSPELPKVPPLLVDELPQEVVGAEEVYLGAEMGLGARTRPDGWSYAQGECWCEEVWVNRWLPWVSHLRERTRCMEIMAWQSVKGGTEMTRVQEQDRSCYIWRRHI